ncbi:MAG: hypothetical protein ACI8RA_002933 [Chlamydiales bacterium]|jgi:hypothetical protein
MPINSPNPLPKDLVLMISDYQSKEDAISFGKSSKKDYPCIRDRITKRAALEKALLVQEINQEFKCIPLVFPVSMIPAMVSKTEKIAENIKKLMKTLGICIALSPTGNGLSTTDMLQIHLITDNYSKLMLAPIIDFQGFRL